MFLWHQPHLDPHPPGVQGSRAGLQPNLCLWDTQGQGQGAQRLKDHCLLCVHHCGFCHRLHTHNHIAPKPANCPVCSHWNCLSAHSNSTASNNLCSQGNYACLLQQHILHVQLYYFCLILYMYFTNTNADVLTVQESQRWGKLGLLQYDNQLQLEWVTAQRYWCGQGEAKMHIANLTLLQFYQCLTLQ